MTIGSKLYLRSVSFRPGVELDPTQYPHSIPAVRALDGLTFDRAVTFLVGENGSGKSTIVEAIAVAWGFNAEGGSQHFRFGTKASHTDLHTRLRLARSTRRAKDGFFLRAESFYNVATNVEELDKNGGPSNGPPFLDGYGGCSPHEQSHGESFFSLLTHRFRGEGFYVLDEPEAALSPARQLAAMVRIHELVTRGSQFLIATHSPMLLAYPDARVLQLDESGMHPVNYEDTDHFVLTKTFLSNPRQYFHRLFGP